ncbi:Small nuclear ribonucleoprotein E [Fukomys damarensis]|uniref:Small nuclear ribonucleoprotein E n=1 Tax=Fukomys damarensis TaxID=885580 RepID=A0A091D072_FUKDA|nr:Small nuclear ribonucleoprotein E [Fukomys damarensis]
MCPLMLTKSRGNRQNFYIRVLRGGADLVLTLGPGHPIENLLEFPPEVHAGLWELFCPCVRDLRSRIQVWLYEQVNMRIEGCIIGFDEYMNLVLDDAEEIHSKTKSRKQLGRIMLKGDNITLLQSVSN